jgi:hypothetical protein
MKQPMLVRRMEDELSLPERQKLVSDLNEEFSHSREKRAESKSRGDRLSERTLKALTQGMREADSLRQMFDRSDSAPVVEMLIKDGVIQESERNAFVGADGLLNPDGKTVVEQALRGRIARKYETLAALPNAGIGKLDAAIPHILLAENVGFPWNITEDVRDAVDAIAEFSRSGEKSAEIYIDRPDMSSGKSPRERFSKLGISIFRAALSDKKTDFAGKFSRYAYQASVSPEAGAWNVGRPSAPQAQRQIFGKEQAGKDANGKDKPLASLAFQGSPTRGITRMSTDFIGTGEGAQAYGWGLYFADKKEVSEWYRQKLTPKTRSLIILGDEQISLRSIKSRSLREWLESKADELIESNEELADDEIITYRLHNTIQKYKEFENLYLLEDEDGLLESYGEDEIERMREDLAEANRLEDASLEIELSDNPGQLYEVEIPDSDVLLDYDKPLSEQPEKVKNALKKESLFGPYSKGKGGHLDNTGHNNTGGALYRAMSAMYGSAQAASKKLNSYGISGLRYFDGISRFKSEGSYNYVIWDDKAIEILRTYYSISPGEHLPAPRRKIQIRQRADAIANVVKGLAEQAQNAVPTRVVQGYADLPENIRRAYPGREGSLEGVYDPQSKSIWMVADNLTDRGRAADVWAHEAIVHGGLRSMFEPEQLKMVLDKMWIASGNRNFLFPVLLDSFHL